MHPPRQGASVLLNNGTICAMEIPRLPHHPQAQTNFPYVPDPVIYPNISGFALGRRRPSKAYHTILPVVSEGKHFPTKLFLCICNVETWLWTEYTSPRTYQ
jgi:hypothetical protein